MSKSELVTAHHLARKAMIYIRQSSPHQVLTNQESTRLQYALQQRAIQLGWRPEDIEIIDADLGLTATAAQHREGFKELVTKVTLGQVGIILSYEVTRLSRNCSDWYPLLDICGYKRCLIGDNIGVYDPGTLNGRMLLGLKGQLSEMEGFTIRARLTDGLLNKAQRGELALTLPVGLVRDETGTVYKDPNLEVQHRIDLIFKTFLQRKSANKVLQFFHEQDLCIPRRDYQGDLVWKKPTVAAILSILRNPAYTGTFVYGRSRSVRKEAASPQVSRKRLPVAEWKFKIHDQYPAYINWETYVKIQTMLKDNYAEYDREKTRGIPRSGAALLQGIIYCGECSHKLMVQYKPSPQYLCNYLRHQYGVPVCQTIPADPVDARVVDAFFEALSPIELDVYARAVAAQIQTEEKTKRARAQQLERLRYQATLAQKQFHRVDPDNRLVAAELERRWEAALRELQQAEAAAAPPKSTLETSLTLSEDLKEAFKNIGQKLPQIWNQSILSRENKKALLRCLIDKVVVHRAPRDQIQTRIVWRGGATTTFPIPIKVGAMADLSCAQDLEAQVLKLVEEGLSDAEVAQRLTTMGYRSPTQLHVLPSTVQNIRLNRGLYQKRSQSHPRRVAGYLTVTQLANELKLARHWIYDRIDKGCIQVALDHETGLYLFPDKPATLEMFKKLRDGKLYNLRFS